MLNENSIAWKVAKRAYEEGVIFILTNVPSALRMGSVNELAKKYKTEVIPADATSIEDLEKLLNKSIEMLGGKIDFIYILLGCQ